MEISKKHTPGSMKVSEEVLVKIAQTAASEIEGVDVGTDRMGVVIKKNPVRAKVIGEAAAIRMNLNILEGFNAVSVAEGVQRSVKSAVQNMTGFTVTKVDVNIMGVSYKDNTEVAQ